MTSCPTLAEVVDAIESLYPPRWADEGDPIGLVVGDPASEVRRILFAVDPVQAVVDEAVAKGIDLVVVHHPLLYRAVNAVAATSPKGKVVHQLISHGIGLYVAHTNADSPPQGVSESLAHAIGLSDLRPLATDAADALDKIVTFVPQPEVDQVLDALARAGAGAVGDYDRCAFVVDGRGTFRPGERANPTIGNLGQVEVVAETRLEMVVARSRRLAAVEALRAAHPYEEPAFDIIELAHPSTDRGTGRVGRLPNKVTLREFADSVVTALPATAVGARVAGDLDRAVTTVAVVGGAGDFMLDAARAAGVDVYVTSDLRHHPASEFREYDGAALVDLPHWAAEWTWLPVAQEVVTATLAERGHQVDTEVSRICTDPWNYRAPSDATTDAAPQPRSPR